ncbi:interaptin [Macadamia integrifolia]|uniref:interaptin n=1 Tax=Macadamia integrifolia TaxID=60698 RepID=UPI001C4F0D2A|nr:interaptin [Macadamia integrifolia]XP_042492991.1 interaptin [Macadamia integrifolia]XP_042492992.1 interaptin [Macadamia integrifolia]XP_042492993.1 interaptin [Macadamia integrifolia]
MSRISKWKDEKLKVKVVFRLQFHATHILQTGWDKLFVSLFPADSGKATAKTTKANVRNGTCKWADPIYETTRLLQHPRTKEYDEKLYKLIVAMGSSRSSFLGEANINLADYADASKPCAVALPLHGCDSGAVLHVTVQLLTSKTGFREFEQQRELREKGFRMLTKQNVHDSVQKLSASSEIANDQVDVRIRFKSESRELASLEEDVELTEDHADSAVGIDESSNTSESIYAEKHDTSSNHEIDSLKSAMSGELGGLSLGQSHQPEKKDPSDLQILQPGSSDWGHGWSSDYSLDNDLTTAYEENSRLRESLEVAESSILELKLLVSTVQSHADELGAETQKYSEQLAAEIASGERLEKEVSSLKSECSNLKFDFEQLRHSRSSPQTTNKEIVVKENNCLLLDVQMKWMQGLLVMEDKLREVQNKACLRYSDCDVGFLFTDLEALQRILHNLKQGIIEEVSVINLLPMEVGDMKGNGAMTVQRPEHFTGGDGGRGLEGFDANDSLSEGMLHGPGQISGEAGSIDVTSAMETRFCELQRELEESKAEREDLSRKMGQMECYYEALVQGLEESQKQMLVELQNLRNEHSSCLFTISSLETQMETMHQDMNDQLLKFAEDRQSLESLNKELEKRALTSEAALRMARLNYSVAVDRLQKDLELLSFQVLSMFETNENLIRQAFAEGSQLCFQEYVETVDQGNAPLLDQCKTPTQGNHAKLLFQNENSDLNNQFLGGEVLLQDLKRLLRFQEDRYQMIETELYEMHVVNMHLDVFSKVLQETLHETCDGFRLMEEKANELAQQLEHSTDSKELLMLQLKTALDDVNALSEYKASCVTKCNDLALRTQILEEKLESISSENCRLTQKIMEYEGLMMESRSYKSKYSACTAENMELLNLLKQETLEKDNLMKDISSLHEELTVVKAEFVNQVSVRDNLDKTVIFLRDKLGDLISTMLSYTEQLNAPVLQGESLQQDLQNNDLINSILHLGELQKEACEKIIQLVQEKKAIEEERDNARSSLSGMKSEILSMKQMFASEMEDMVTKLALSHAHVEKLQQKLEGFASKLMFSSESEENYAEQNQELLSKVELLEVELQHVVTENRDIAQKILALESVNEELERTKRAVFDIRQENHALMTSLAADNEDSVKLAMEFDNLKESLRCVNAELTFEKGIRAELEGTVADLTAQLNKKHDQLLGFDKQKAELVNLKQLVSDLELEKSRVSSLLVHSELCLKEADENASSLHLQVTELETCLAEVYEYLLAADVELVFTRNQFQTRMQELNQQLNSLDGHHEELCVKHLDVLSTLNRHTAIEERYVEENARLLTALDSLKSELEASVTERKVLADKDKERSAELEMFKTQAEHQRFKTEAAIAEAGEDIKDSHWDELEVERLKHMLGTFEEEINKLRSSRDEMEITVTVLRAKLDEQCGKISLLEEYDDELMMLRKQHSELTHKLSEQTLKTEEFKNLSIHLKELKDQVDAECIQAREKKEPEALSVTMQESLRIAFIREQCETKLQELRSQLCGSKKHGEEMLLKLQDALDEVENRKKSEASHTKKTKEMSLKILELETELQSVLSDKREKVNAYDGMKAELECSLISLDCCKEDKQKLEASLQKCEEEKSRIAVELCSMREQLRDISIREDGNSRPGIGECMPSEQFMDVQREVSLEFDQYLNSLDRDRLLRCKLAEDECSLSSNESSQSSSQMTMQSIQDNTVSQSVLGSPIQVIMGNEAILQNHEKNVALISDHFKAQSLKSSMDLLHRELERIKNENIASSLLHDDHQCEPAFPGLQKELLQLHEANKQLGNLFPFFNKFSTSGNALERVLALEIELAEALQAKKKSSIHFQSSFLKQHSDEEAVFQSFRDINDLIKDMLELKGRYRAVDNELKEMHGRYSELSLRFAEVEGERQRLLMTLKNNRVSSKKSSRLNFTTSANVEDLS